MKENLTELVFVIDRSGSMHPLVADTVGGFNNLIEEQKKIDGEALVTTVLFNNHYEMIHDGVNIKEVEELLPKRYSVGGMTAMLDAIGKTINDIGHRLSNTKEEDRPSKVMFIIITDGHENASVEFSLSQIKEMIKRQTETYNWEFLFLGANIDSATEASNIGISPQRACNFTPSSIGTSSLYETVSKAVMGYRTVGSLESDWSSNIK